MWSFSAVTLLCFLTLLGLYWKTLWHVWLNFSDVAWPWSLVPWGIGFSSTSSGRTHRTQSRKSRIVSLAASSRSAWKHRLSPFGGCERFLPCEGRYWTRSQARPSLASTYLFWDRSFLFRKSSFTASSRRMQASYHARTNRENQLAFLEWTSSSLGYMPVTSQTPFFQ